jgi:predicted nucleotidyltransferase
VVGLAHPAARAEVRLVVPPALRASLRAAFLRFAVALVVRLADASAPTEMRLVLGLVAFLVLVAHCGSLLRDGRARIVAVRPPARARECSYPRRRKETAPSRARLARGAPRGGHVIDDQGDGGSSPPEERTFVDVLSDAVSAMEDNELDYVLIGGIASAVLGRPRATRDIDLFVRAEDIEAAVRALDDAGFDTKEPELDWLYKADKNEIQVDVIFKSSGDIYLDEAMSERALETEFKGQRVRLVPAEDLLVMKALSHDEETPQYWYDALAIIATNELDWDYVLSRAGHGARRMLSLLAYAQSTDHVVPDSVLRRLFEEIYEV